jgi:hypothetical protein
MTAKALNIEHSDVKKAGDAISSGDPQEPPAAGDREGQRGLNWSVGPGRRARVEDPRKDMRSRVTDTFLEMLLQILLLPIQIIGTSFTAIIVALLYLKTRQAGGESLQDLLAKFEDTDRPRKKWQERVRQRLIQSGRITGRT